METPVWSTQTMPAQIHDLWAAQSRIWNTELISQIFDREATQCITHVPIVQSDSQDIVRWTPAKKGVCTTKEAFKMLNNDMQVLNSSTGAGGVTQQAQGILQRIWKHKTLPHILKTFTWRLIRRALGLWLLDIEQEGSLRKLTDFVLYANKLKMTHIFFHLLFRKSSLVFSYTISPHFLLPQNRVEFKIPYQLFFSRSHHLTVYKESLQLWYIWKARNDLRFQNKKWSVLQVHYAMAVDIKMSLLHNQNSSNNQSTGNRLSNAGPTYIQRNTCTLPSMLPNMQDQLTGNELLPVNLMNNASIVNPGNATFVQFECRRKEKARIKLVTTHQFFLSHLSSKSLFLFFCQV